MKNQKPLIVLSHPISGSIIREELTPHARVQIASNPKHLAQYLKQAEALICMLTVAVDLKLLKKATQLKAVGNIAVGYNNIDLTACKAQKIRIVNTPDVLTRSTAELALTLLLAAARRLPEGEALCRSEKFKGWAHDLLLGQELKGRHAVILGRGRIGMEFGQMLRSLGLTIEWITRKDSRSTILKKLSKAQVFSIHTPYSKENHHWLNAERIAALPGDSIVLNTARGPLVDEAALIQALKKKKIFAAGLDVFEHEPKIPLALRRLKNVVLLPHLGSATDSAREAMARLACRGVIQILKGKNPKNEVKF